MSVELPPPPPPPTSETRPVTQSESLAQALDPTKETVNEEGFLLEGGIPLDEKRYTSPYMGSIPEGVSSFEPTSFTVEGVDPNDHVRIYIKTSDGSVVVVDVQNHPYSRLDLYPQAIGDIAVTDDRPEVVVLKGAAGDEILDEMMLTYDDLIGLNQEERSELLDKSEAGARSHVVQPTATASSYSFAVDAHPNVVQREIMGITHPDAQESSIVTWQDPNDPDVKHLRPLPQPTIESDPTPIPYAAVDTNIPPHTTTPSTSAAESPLSQPTPRAMQTTQLQRATPVPTETPRPPLTTPSKTETTQAATPTAEPLQSTEPLDIPDSVDAALERLDEFDHTIVEDSDGRIFLEFKIPSGVDMYFLTKDKNGNEVHTYIDNTSGSIEFPYELEVTEGWLDLVVSDDQTPDNLVDQRVRSVEDAHEELQKIQKKQTVNGDEMVITQTIYAHSGETIAIPADRRKWLKN